MKHFQIGFILAIFLFLFTPAAYSIDAMLLTSLDLNYSDKWSKTESETTPSFSTVSSVYKNQYFNILLLFSDYSLDSNRKAKITFDVKIVDPNKKTYFEQKNITAFAQDVKSSKLVLLSDAVLKISFEDSDSHGIYRIETNIYDQNSGKTVSKSKKIRLTYFEHSKYFNTDDELQDWFSTFYHAPSPEKAISAYLYYTQSKLNEAKNGFIPVFSFFLSVFNNNHFLVPILKETYSEQNLKTKIYIIWLLRYLDYDSDTFFKSLKGKEKQIFDQIKQKAFPLYKDKVVSGEHLDVQWATFLATGKFEPIGRIINALEYSRYSGSVEAYTNSKKTEEDRKKAILDATFQAARWSIKANIQQHELVKKYCIYTFINDDYSNDIKLWLGLILSKQVPDRFKMVKDDEGSWTIKY